MYLNPMNLISSIRLRNSAGMSWFIMKISLPAQDGCIVNHTGKLERICILKPYRKYGLGKVIISELENMVKEKGITQCKLHGQTHAEGFYHKLGYQTDSPEFMEDGIPHVLMTKELA